GFDMTGEALVLDLRAIAQRLGDVAQGLEGDLLAHPVEHEDGGGGSGVGDWIGHEDSFLGPRGGLTPGRRLAKKRAAQSVRPGTGCATRRRWRFYRLGYTAPALPMM